MGMCATCGVSEQEKALQEQQAAAEQKRQAFEPVRLLSSSPEVELSEHEANTVLEVLQIRAEQMALPKAAAAWLKLEFSVAIISHDRTLKEAGLCDQAKISVLEDEAKRKLNDLPNIRSAAKGGKFDEVQLVLDYYPNRVHAKDQVIAPGAHLIAADSVLVDGQGGFAYSSGHPTPVIWESKVFCSLVLVNLVYNNNGN